MHEKIRANIDRIPVGIPEPLIVGRGINDVAVVVLTLSPKPDAAARWTDKDLYQLADELRSELVKIDNVGLTYISGGNAQQIRVEPDPEKLALFGVTLQQLVAKVRDANRSFQAGSVRDNGTMRDVAAGQTLTGVPDIGLLLRHHARQSAGLCARRGQGGDRPEPAGASRLDGHAASKGGLDRAPAVSVAFAKRAGANAVVVAERSAGAAGELEGRLIPPDVEVTVTRDYGETANEKANELLFHLGLATMSIVVLIAFAIGWREALVTLVVIPTTILLTLFASNLMGYTINRVSLFALIFSIGILVDDAIVVVENIARHWAMKDGRIRMQAAIEAVAEVGNPTIVATLTVVAALLPMLFVSGLMGPYMAPIPANASAAMLFSFFVAMVIAPWLMLRLHPEGQPVHEHEAAHGEGLLGRLYRRFAAPIMRTRRRAWIFLISVGVATRRRLRAVRHQERDGQAAAVRQQVRTGGGRRSAGGRDAGGHRAHVVLDRRLSPGNCRKSARSRPMPARRRRSISTAWCATIICASRRSWASCNSIWRRAASASRASHAIALDLRARLKQVTLPTGTVARVVEVPPGPPVLATLLAEVYGPDSKTRRAVVAELKTIFASVPYIVDIDDSIGQPRPRLRISIDQDRLEFFGVEQRDVYDTIQALLGGTTVGYSHRGEGRNPIEIAVRLPKRDLSWSELLASTPVPANSVPGNKTVVELGDVVRVSNEAGSPTIFRRDGRFADMVMAELAGAYEAPIYGMLAVDKLVDAHDWGKLGTADDPPPRPARGRKQAGRCCGTANGRSPTSPSATWARRSWSPSSASICWSSRSSAASGCRW